MVDAISHSWATAIASLVNEAGNCVRICSPYVGKEPCEYLAELVPLENRQEIKLELLTNLSYENMISRSTDVRGLLTLHDSFPNSDIRFLPHLHAKIYSSQTAAIVTSANFTRSGFHRNLEYGFVVRESQLAAKVFDDAKEFHSIGTPVSRDELQVFDLIVEEMSELQRDMQKSVRLQVRKAF